MSQMPTLNICSLIIERAMSLMFTAELYTVTEVCNLSLGEHNSNMNNTPGSCSSFLDF